MENKLDLKKVLQNVVKLLLSVAAIYIILQNVDEKQALDYIKGVNYLFLFGAFVTFFISKAVSTLRINRFYKAKGFLLSDLVNFRLSLAGFFYNLFIPIIGGEGYKIFWLKKNKNIDLKTASVAALLDRASGLVALFVLISLLFQVSTIQIEFKYAALLILPAVYLIQYTVMKYAFPGFLSANVINSGLSLLVQIFQMTTVYLVIRSLHIEENQVDYVFVFMLATLAYVLPFIGAREMAFVFGAEYLGLDKDISFAIGILFYLAQTGTSLPGIFFMVFPSKIQGKELE